MEAREGDSAAAEEQVVQMARYLGFADDEAELLWIAREALEAPLPAGWAVASDAQGNTYYFDVKRGETRWESPTDEHFRALYRKHASERAHPPESGAALRHAGERISSARFTRAARIGAPAPPTQRARSAEQERPWRAGMVVAGTPKRGGASCSEPAAASPRSTAPPASLRADPSAHAHSPQKCGMSPRTMPTPLPPQQRGGAGHTLSVPGALPLGVPSDEPKARRADAAATGRGLAEQQPRADAGAALRNSTFVLLGSPGREPAPAAVRAVREEVYWGDVLPRLAPAGVGRAPDWQQRLLARLKLHISRAHGKPLITFDAAARAPDAAAAREAATAAARAATASTARPHAGPPPVHGATLGGGAAPEDVAALRGRLLSNFAPPPAARHTGELIERVRDTRARRWRSIAKAALALPEANDEADERARALDALATQVPGLDISDKGAAARAELLVERKRNYEDLITHQQMDGHELDARLAAMRDEERTHIEARGAARTADAAARDRYSARSAHVAHSRLQQAQRRLAEATTANAQLKAHIDTLRGDRRKIVRKLAEQAVYSTKMDGDMLFLSSYVEAEIDSRDRIARTLVKHVRETEDERRARLTVADALGDTVERLHKSSAVTHESMVASGEWARVSATQRARDAARERERRRVRLGLLRTQSDAWAGEFEQLAAISRRRKPSAIAPAAPAPPGSAATPAPPGSCHWPRASVGSCGARGAAADGAGGCASHGAAASGAEPAPMPTRAMADDLVGAYRTMATQNESLAAYFDQMLASISELAADVGALAARERALLGARQRRRDGEDPSRQRGLAFASAGEAPPAPPDAGGADGPRAGAHDDGVAELCSAPADAARTHAPAPPAGAPTRAAMPSRRAARIVARCSVDGAGADHVGVGGPSPSSAAVEASRADGAAASDDLASSPRAPALIAPGRASTPRVALTRADGDGAASGAAGGGGDGDGVDALVRGAGARLPFDGARASGGARVPAELALPDSPMRSPLALPDSPMRSPSPFELALASPASALSLLAIRRVRASARALDLAELEEENSRLSVRIREVCRAVHGTALALQAAIPDDLAFLGCKLQTLDAFLAIVDENVDALWARASLVWFHVAQRRTEAARVESQAAAAAAASAATGARLARACRGRTADGACAAASASLAASADAQFLSRPDILGQWIDGPRAHPAASRPSSPSRSTVRRHGLDGSHWQSGAGSSARRDDASPAVLRTRPPGPACAPPRIDGRLLRRHMAQLLTRKEQDDLDLEDTPDDGVVVFRSTLVPRHRMHEYVDRALARCQAESAELSSASASAARERSVTRGWSADARARRATGTRTSGRQGRTNGVRADDPPSPQTGP
ncbi:hypothetical protein KFE25_007664 [Diacronema lutheri]|uniref:WW domain-containing protein n=1 Tax=Diacronema lutheri TaxID=2081491 RepID=A0A8J6CFI1_DIALT|nr:hypothetical protein KFE25_007664 [Diacronema lutheri]